MLESCIQSYLALALNTDCDTESMPYHALTGMIVLDLQAMTHKHKGKTLNLKNYTKS